MMGIILTFVFGWLLCGAWTIRMLEKDSDIIEKSKFWLGLFYMTGMVGLIIMWFVIWPKRIWKFCECFVSVFKQALKESK